MYMRSRKKGVETSTLSASKITSQHARGVITRRAQLMRQLERIHRIVRLARRHLVHIIAPDTIQASVLDDHRVATLAIVVDVRTVAIGITTDVVRCGAHFLDGCVWLFADPFQEHDFDRSEVPAGYRVVAFGDALPIGAVEQVMAHDPAATFAVRSLCGVAV